MNPESQPTVMTVREVAAYLRVTVSTVYKLLHGADLPGKKVGGQWRISKATIEKWLEGKEEIGERQPASERAVADGEKYAA